LKKFDFIGEVDQEGKFKIYDRAFLDKFFLLNKGARILGHFEVDQAGMSKSDQGYYFAVVRVHWQAILREAGYNYNLAQTHEYIKQFSPVTHEQLTFGGVESTRIKSISELSEDEFKQYIEDLKRLAAESFDHFIPDKTPADAREESL
jgi:hypothetical protein